MAVHDWSRVDANVFHDFHQIWSVGIRNALNAGLLPSGYSALVEQHAAGLIPDVLAVQRRRRTPPKDVPAGGVLTATPPQTRFVRQTKAALAARGNRIVIRHRLGEVVCVLEIVSPGNKSGRAALRQFVEKTAEFLKQGVHRLVIDLLPPTPRDPQGMHKAIWDEFEEEPFELPPDKPLTLASYVAGDLTAGLVTTAYVETIGVGDVIPDMPAYLDNSGYVSVPLEATYLAAWATCPPDMRELVETGRLAGEE